MATGQSRKRQGDLIAANAKDKAVFVFLDYFEITKDRGGNTVGLTGQSVKGLKALPGQ